MLMKSDWYKIDQNQACKVLGVRSYIAQTSPAVSELQYF